MLSATHQFLWTSTLKAKLNMAGIRCGVALKLRPGDIVVGAHFTGGATIVYFYNDVSKHLVFEIVGIMLRILSHEFQILIRTKNFMKKIVVSK